MTPTTSPSPAAASNMPRLTNIGPPGSAKALMSFRLTGVNEVLEDRVVEIRGRGRDEALAQPIEVGAEKGIFDQRVLLANVGGSFATELHVLFRRVLVSRRRDLRLRGEKRSKSDDPRTENQKSLAACRPHRR